MYIEPHKTLNNQSNPEKEEQVEGITLPVFMLYYKAVIIKWYGSGTKTDE